LKFLNICQKKLTGHSNIVKFIAAASIGKEESGQKASSQKLLMELCGGKFLSTFNNYSGK